MRPPEVRVYLSCSFDPADAEVNAFFKSLCQGLAIQCVSEAGGHSRPWPTKAAGMIKDSQGLIVIATQRAGVSGVSQSIAGELMTAAAENKPVLVLAEDSVSLDYVRNYGTPFTFSRPGLTQPEPEFLCLCVKTLNEFKTELIDAGAIVWGMTPCDGLSEETTILNEVDLVDGDPEWQHHMVKRFRYERNQSAGINMGVATSHNVRIPEGAPAITYKIESDDRDGLEFEARRHSAAGFEGQVLFQPPPKVGEHRTVSAIARSRYINPVFAEDLRSPENLRLGERVYACFDGFIAPQPTRKTIFRQIYKAGLAPPEDAVGYFAGRYTNTLDHLSARETERMDFSYKRISSAHAEIKIEVDNPLPGFLYAIAWQPPTRKSWEEARGG